MTLLDHEAPAAVPPAPRRPGWVGVGLMLSGASSSQVGAAVGALAFPVIGPVGVVAVRQWIAATVLVVTVRPRVWRFTGHQLRPVLALAGVFAVMNLTLYTAIDRVGLGLAITLEFLGPLGVALVASRRRVDLACALTAAVGVVVLTRPQPSTDYLGITVALVAACCWAAYILLNRTLGIRVPGVEASAAAALFSSLAYVPVGIWWLSHHRPTPLSLACAATAGLMSTALPMLTDMMALRRVPTQFFGLFMSVNPVLAALVGWVVLGQGQGRADWVGIALIVAANAAASAVPPRGARPRHADPAAHT